MCKRLFPFILALMLACSGCNGPSSTASSAPIASATEEPTPSAMVCQTPAATAKPVVYTAYSPDDPWVLTDQIGGTTKALFLEGDTLFLGCGLHVMILDVSDPKAMRVVGTSPMLPQFVESIVSDGAGCLYVCCGSGGLVLLDVSNPASPTILASLDTRGYTEGVALYGDYAVLADGPQGVQIADVSNPGEPAIVSEAYPLAYVYDIAIKDHIAYAAGGGSGLFVVDLSDPGAPVEQGLIAMAGLQYDVEIVGGKLYLAGAWGGISTFNIAIPLEPKLVDTISTTGWAMALKMIGNNLYVMDGADGAMLYDLSGSSPALCSTYTRGGFIAAGAANGTTAFLLDEEYGLMAVDYTDPSAPQPLSRWMPLTEARRAALSGTTAYVAGGLSGMHVIDLGDGSSARETFCYSSDGGYVNNILIDGNTAYMTTHIDTSEPLVVFDVSDPLTPVKVGAVPNDADVFNSAFRSMALGDGYVYIAGEHAVLTVDVNDPTKPKVKDLVYLDVEPNSAAVRGNLFITGSRLQVFDVSDPQNIEQLAVADNNSSGEAVAFLDDTTVLCAGDEALWFMDVSDPTNPQKVAELPISGSIMDAKVCGTDLYLCTLGNGIQIADISDPLQPVLTDTIFTLGDVNSCYVSGDMMLVADSVAGLTIYKRGAARQDAQTAAAQTVPAEPYMLQLLLGEDVMTTPYAPPEPMSAPAESHAYVVTSTADSGEGSLRYALEHLEQNTTITFDPSVFIADKPAVIALESPLPRIETDFLTLDASDAGVILDGSQLAEGNGLTLSASCCKIMGLQIVNFPGNGIQAEGNWNQLGGSRAIGTGPLGQGNLASGNGICGIVTGGWYTEVLGNLVGTDITGTEAYPNYDGIFVTDWGFYVTVGSANPDESNIASGNEWINMDTWGDHTRIIGNIIGLDIAGAKAVRYETASNLTIETGSINTIVGGTTPGERNIISGAQSGVTFSDSNSYQNAVIGNYIGTDITGTKAVGNRSGGGIWACSHHRIGGNAEGEGNLISGNENAGAGLSGYGCRDNIIMGNRIGFDANGNPLPNGSGIDINTGQRHGTIGGYTAAEGNVIFGGSFAMRITNRGVQDCYIAGNTITGAGIYLEDRATNNFIQSNVFGELEGNPVRADYGTGNEIRGNIFPYMENTAELILLLEGANFGLPAPLVTQAAGSTVSGSTVARGRVEVYLVEKTQITLLGCAYADAEGNFTFTADTPLRGKKIILNATDEACNTSAFTQPYKVG